MNYLCWNINILIQYIFFQTVQSSGLCGGTRSYIATSFASSTIHRIRPHLNSYPLNHLLCNVYIVWIAPGSSNVVKNQVSSWSTSQIMQKLYKYFCIYSHSTFYVSGSGSWDSWCYSQIWILEIINCCCLWLYHENLCCG